MTLFLNQSSQTFEVFLELISGTSVQNFSRKKCFILPWQHIPLRVLRQNRVLEIIDDVTVTSFCSKSQKHLVFLSVIPRIISVQNLSEIGQKTKELQVKAEIFLKAGGGRRDLESVTTTLAPTPNKNSYYTSPMFYER